MSEPTLQCTLGHSCNTVNHYICAAESPVEQSFENILHLPLILSQSI